MNEQTMSQPLPQSVPQPQQYVQQIPPYQSCGTPYNQYNPGYQPAPLSPQTPSDNFQLLFEKLENIDKKLYKLDVIEKQLSTMTQKINILDDRVCSLEKTADETKKKMIDIESSRSFDAQVTDEIQKTQKNQQQELNDRKQKLERTVNAIDDIRHSGNVMDCHATAPGSIPGRDGVFTELHVLRKGK